MPFQIGRRSVTRGQDSPSGFVPYAVVLARRGQCPRQRDPQAVRVDDCRVTGGGRPFRQRPFVKNGYRA